MTTTRNSVGGPRASRPADPTPSPNGDPQAPKRLSPEEQKLVLVTRRLERDNFVAALGNVLPKYLDPRRMVQVALLACTRQPELLNCTPESIAQSVMTVAQWGLEIGRTAHLVPYSGQAQAQIAWQGVCELAYRTAGVLITPELIYKNDDFRFERGLNPVLHHVPAWQSDPGPLVGAYAVATFPDGRKDFEVMTKAQVEHVRGKSRAFRNVPGKRGPWESDEPEMWRKTVVKRLGKRLPQNWQLAAALANDLDEERRAEAAEEIMQATRVHVGVRDPQESYGAGPEPEPAQVTGGDPQAQTASEIAQPPREEVRMEDKPKVQAARRATDNAADPYHCEHGVSLAEPCVECQELHGSGWGE